MDANSNRSASKELPCSLGHVAEKRAVAGEWEVEGQGQEGDETIKIPENSVFCVRNASGLSMPAEPAV